MLEMGEAYRRELRSMVLRMSCMEHDFVVRNGGGRGVSSSSLGGGGTSTMGSLLEDAGSGMLLPPSLDDGVGIGIGLGAGGKLGEGGGGGGAMAAGATAGGEEADLPEVGASGGTQGVKLASPSHYHAACACAPQQEEGAGGADAERPPEAGGGSSSKPAAPADVMDTVQ
ncbi:unnamed protein product [Sphacelaria rigidula]